MKEISYPYLVNQLRKGIVKALAVGFIFLVAALGFRIFSGNKEPQVYTAYGSYKVTILDELDADGAVETYETVTRILATTVKTTVFKQEFLNFAAGKEWAKGYDIHNLGDVFLLNVSSRSFDIEISSTQSEFTRHAQEYLLRYFSQLEEYVGISLRIEAHDVGGDDSGNGHSAGRSDMMLAFIFFALGFTLTEGIIALSAQWNDTVKGAADLRNNTDLEVYSLGKDTEIMLKKLKGEQPMFIVTAEEAGLEERLREAFSLSPRQIIADPLSNPEELKKLSLKEAVVLVTVKEKSSYRRLAALSDYLKKLECRVLGAVLYEDNRKSKYDLPC